MYRLLAITMLMPVVKKLFLNEYRSIDEMIRTNIFQKIMARDRYDIIANVNFNNNNNIKNDLLIKRPIVNSFKICFLQSFYLYKDMCIENFLFLQSRYYFKQFNLFKGSRFSIKSFILCDYTTNYVLNFIIYTGKNTVSSQLYQYCTIGKCCHDTSIRLVHMKLPLRLHLWHNLFKNPIDYCQIDTLSKKLSPKLFILVIYFDFCTRMNSTDTRVIFLCEFKLDNNAVETTRNIN